MAAEEVDGDAHREAGEFGVVAVAFVAEEGVGAVELVPGEGGIRGGESGVDFGAAFAGDVRVLAAPDHHELAFDVGNAGERVVGFAKAEAALMNVGRVEAGGCGDLGEHGGSEGEMSAETDADRADASGAAVVAFQIRDDAAGVIVVGGDGLGVFEFVALVGTWLVVGEHGAGGEEFVIDFRHGDDEPVAGEEGGGATDGRGDLENLGIENEAGVTSGAGGAKDHAAHGTAGSGEIYEVGFTNGHEREANAIWVRWQ